MFRHLINNREVVKISASPTIAAKHFVFRLLVVSENRSPSRGKIIAENSESRAGELLGFLRVTPMQ